MIETQQFVAPWTTLIVYFSVVGFSMYSPYFSVTSLHFMLDICFCHVFLYQEYITASSYHV